MAAKKETQKSIADEAVPEQGSPITINTVLFKTFLEFAKVVADDQYLRFHENSVSFRSRDKGNISLGIVELARNFHNTGEIGVRVEQMFAAMPKTDMVTLTFGEKIGIESTDYKANFLRVSNNDPTLKASRLKNDFVGVGGFVVGAKDFYDKTVTLKSVFKGDPFLAMVSDEKEPGIVTLTTDDNSVGDVHYRLSTSNKEKGESWTRQYDYEILIPILKVASQWTQEIKVSWMELVQNNETLYVLVISGKTPDGAISFSYALAPRIVETGPKEES